MPDKVQELSEELVEEWGPEIRRVTHDLNDLIGRALSQGDVLAFGFITQAVAGIMLEACEIAKQIQVRQREQAGVYH